MRKKISLNVKLILVSFLLIFVAVTAGIGNVETYAIDSKGRCHGVDVSSHNETIDWKAAKADGIDFAIIRIGFGDDDTKQDDSRALTNMAGCEAAGIPYGVYIYSYAISEKEVISEANHTLRMIKGHNPEMGIWYDMEDADFYKERHNFNPYTHERQLTDFCLQFMDIIKSNGYSTVGVYASRDFFTSILDYDAIRANGLIWLAHWGISSPSMDCDIWQYSDSGKVKGIPGSGLDMDLIYPSSKLYPIISNTKEKDKETDELSVDGTFGGIVQVKEGKYYKGDINQDSSIDVMDLAITKKHILKKIVLKGEDAELADVNNDNVIDVMDLALIKKHILKKTDLFSVKENTNDKNPQEDSTEKETTTEAVPEKETTTEAVLEKETTTEAVPEKETTTEAVPEKETTTEAVPEKETTTEAVSEKEPTVEEPAENDIQDIGENKNEKSAGDWKEYEEK